MNDEFDLMNIPLSDLLIVEDDDIMNTRLDDLFVENEIVPEGAELKKVTPPDGPQGQKNIPKESVVRNDVVVPVEKVIKYMRGKATGSEHNITRSKDMAKNLINIGLDDNDENNRKIINILLDNGDSVKSSGRSRVIIEGPNGKLILEPTWQFANNQDKHLVDVIVWKFLTSVVTKVPKPNKPINETGGEDMSDNNKLLYENGCIYADGQLIDTNVIESSVVYNDDGNVDSYSVKSWYGEKYQPLYPNQDFINQGLASYCTDDDVVMEQIYDESSIEQLVELANYAEYIIDTMPAIRALYKRDSSKAIKLTKEILEKNKGDEYLQDEARIFLKKNDVDDDDDIMNTSIN